MYKVRPDASYDNYILRFCNGHNRFYTDGPHSSQALSRLTTRSQRWVHRTDQQDDLTIVGRPSLLDHAIVPSPAAAVACLALRGLRCMRLGVPLQLPGARRCRYRLLQQGHDSRSNRPTINDPARFAVAGGSFARAGSITMHPRSPMGTCSHLGLDGMAVVSDGSRSMKLC